MKALELLTRMIQENRTIARASKMLPSKDKIVAIICNQDNIDTTKIELSVKKVME